MRLCSLLHSVWFLEVGHCFKAAFKQAILKPEYRGLLIILICHPALNWCMVLEVPQYQLAMFIQPSNIGYCNHVVFVHMSRIVQIHP